MSVRALTWSFNLELADVTAKAVLHALADHADEEGKCWPSIERMVRYSGCGEKTVRRALQRLVALGLIEQQSRPGTSNVYLVKIGMTMDPGQNDTPVRATDRSERPDTPVTKSRTPVRATGHPGQSDRRTIKEPSIEPSMNRQGVRASGDTFALKDDWRPPETSRSYAIDKGLDPGNVEEAFKDFFVSGKGRRQKRTTAGWERRWRIWCNTDAERKGVRGGKSETYDQRRIREALAAVRE